MPIHFEDLDSATEVASSRARKPSQLGTDCRKRSARTGRSHQDKAEQTDSPETASCCV